MKKLTLWIVAVLTLSAMLLSVSAAENLLVDNADLLTYQDASELLNTLETISSYHNADIAVVTVDSLYGDSAKEFADNYYDANGYADNGILLLVAMQERQWYISTCGNCISVVEDFGTDALASYFLDDLSSGEYYDAFTSFAYTCDKLLTGPVYDEGPVITYGESTSVFSGKTILICAVIGIVVGLITVLVMRSQLKTVRTQGYAGNYVVDGSLNLTNSRDIYLYRNVTRRERPQSNSSSGGGSRSHGGGGGSF